MRYVKDLTDEEVVEIFKMRAERFQLAEIGALYGWSQSPIYRIIKRLDRAEVKVPAKLVEQAQLVSVIRGKPRIVKAKASNGSVAVSLPGPNARAVALAAYVDAVERLSECEKACIDAGIHKSFFSMYEAASVAALRENEGDTNPGF